tara:strand:- start:7031 stop:8251 length:1221 start_codon:yes stop_codon:yes gene_type:complete
MYYYLLSILKKRAPLLYQFLKKLKNKLFFNKKFINKLNKETSNLLNSIKNESYYEFQKKEFFKTKDKKSKVGILEINNSCNINCVMCDTKSSSRKKKLMSLDLCEKSVKEMHDQGIRSILLHTIGDPLANAKLKDYLKILRKYNMQAGISTNGLMLDKHVDTLTEFFDICSNIRFSIDGVKKETYEKIRFGGIFEKLIENLNLAEKKLKKIGYEFSIDLVISKDNFDELGEFIVFFKKYINNPYKNMHFNFMTSLSPSNDYFLSHNTLKEHTSKNYYCQYASSLIPYVLVDGRVSACCRDYDGSLVVDDINKNKLENMGNGSGFKTLQNAHIEESDKIDNYDLCKSCYIIDTRVSKIWRNNITNLLYKYPNEKAEFYQNFFNENLNFLKNINDSNFKKLAQKYSLV